MLDYFDFWIHSYSERFRINEDVHCYCVAILSDVSVRQVLPAGASDLSLKPKTPKPLKYCVFVSFPLLRRSILMDPDDGKG